MRVSVALASCNGGRYLAAQLESLLGQNRVPDEIVISDDASTDDTLAVARQAAAAHPGLFHILTSPQRQGSTLNFARALAAATGDVIFLSDQDDMWQQDKVSAMLELLCDDPPGGVFCDSTVNYDERHPAGFTHLDLRGWNARRRSGLAAASPAEMLEAFLLRVPPAGHDMAISRELLKIILPFPSLADCHDTWIGLVLAALGRWQFCNRELTLFRQHETNASGSGRKRSWRGELAAARASDRADTFKWNADLYAALLERLAGKLAPATAELLACRMEHSLVRSRLGRQSFAARVRPALGEAFSGRYRRFGRGAKSLIQDLFLRGGRR